MSLAEDYRAGRLSKDAYVTAASIYDSICDDLKIGTRKGKRENLENKHDRDSVKVTLRNNLRYFITSIAHSDLADFKVNNKTVLIPAADAPVIQMLLTASICIRSRVPKQDIIDLDIAQWFRGKFENPQIEDPGDIWNLYTLISGRLKALNDDGIITQETKERWESFLRVRLNYDFAQLCMRLKGELQSFIDASRPLVDFLDFNKIDISDIFLLKAQEIILKIEKELVPLVTVQENYMYFVSQVLVSLIPAIAKASTMVLETALKKTEEGEGDEILSEFGFETDPNLTVLGAPSTWNSLLTMSLTQNSSLKGKLVGNHTISKNLNELISSISDKESKELEKTTEFGYFGEVKKIKKRRRRRKRRKKAKGNKERKTKEKQK